MFILSRLSLFHKIFQVLSLGMGLIVNLLDEWTNYKAAYAAISGVIDTARANKLANEHYMTLTDIKLPQVQ